MRRRRVLAGAAGLLLAGCGRSADVAPGPAPSLPPPSSAWFPTPVYALTLVGGRSPAAVVTRLGARPIGSRRWPASGWGGLSGLRATDHVVAVTRLPGWAVAVEDSASLVGDDAIAALSAGTRLVHYAHNVQAADRFVLAADGAIRVDFDPGFPVDRSGADPDALLGAMRAVGLDPADYGHVPPEEAALALAERVTGVTLSAGILRDSTYLAAAITVQANTGPSVRRHP